MDYPYLIDIRTAGEIKYEFRDIIEEAADEFDVRAVADPRPVPVIPLYGRYDTDQGSTVKARLTDVLSDFDVVPYRVSAFDANASGTQVYASVHPSVELLDLRRRIVDSLRPITETPSDDWQPGTFRFGVPIARLEGENVESGSVLDYLTDRFDSEYDEYATRVTNVVGNDMLWEYDLLQDTVLDQQEATSRSSWERTTALLREQADGTDLESLVPHEVSPVLEFVLSRGWEHFPDPPEHVRDSARQNALVVADGSRGRRTLYTGENYVYLIAPTGNGENGIMVFSKDKSEFYDETIDHQCPICGSESRQYEDAPLLPCQQCGLILDGAEASGRTRLERADEAEPCIRCKQPVRTGGVRFDEYLYCNDCVEDFEEIAEQGVIVESRHGKPDQDRRPYLIRFAGRTREAQGQVTALAKGREMMEEEDVPGLFIYRKSGSCWPLEEYVAVHPELRSKVRRERQQVRVESLLPDEDLSDISLEGRSEGSPRQTSGNHKGGQVEPRVSYTIRAEDGDILIGETPFKDGVVGDLSVDHTDKDRIDE